MNNKDIIDNIEFAIKSRLPYCAEQRHKFKSPTSQPNTIETNFEGRITAYMDIQDVLKRCKNSQDEECVDFTKSQFERLIDDIAHYIVNLEDNRSDEFSCHAEMYENTIDTFVNNYFGEK